MKRGGNELTPCYEKVTLEKSRNSNKDQKSADAEKKGKEEKKSRKNPKTSNIRLSLNWHRRRGGKNEFPFNALDFWRVRDFLRARS